MVYAVRMLNVPGYCLTLAKCGTQATQWISSLRNGMESNCVFGTYRAPATKKSWPSITSANPATIRIDNEVPDTNRLPDAAFQV
jgi:hypothetical protein